MMESTVLCSGVCLVLICPMTLKVAKTQDTSHTTWGKKVVEEIKVYNKMAGSSACEVEMEVN